MMKKKMMMVLCGVMVASFGFAEMRLAALFSEGMVLQRGKPVPVWGWDEPGATVRVEFAGQKKSAECDANGKWTVMLDPMPASAEARTMTVSSSIGPKRSADNFPPGNSDEGAVHQQSSIGNILVGEVWLCSGQSNMQMSMNGIQNAGEEKKKADFPQIRMFLVPLVANPEVQDSCGGEWVVCSPTSINQYSAVAYFFGRKLHQELGVPVGLIRSAWGGTRCESWSPKASLAGFDSVQELTAKQDRLAEGYDEEAEQKKYKNRLAAWEERTAAAEAAGKKKPNQPKAPVHPQWVSNYPGNLYNAMIHPLVPYGIRGAIWYQGEANTKTLKEGLGYKILLTNMVEQWRRDWNETFPFFAVQLPSFNANGRVGWVHVREAVFEFQQEAPNAGMAVTIDVGDPTDIHPKNKKPVGERLALQALKKTYGLELVCEGPMFRSAEPQGGKIVIHFNSIGSGLTVQNGEALQWFELAGEDGVFVPAKAAIVGDTVEVRAKPVTKPLYVRYAWENNPVGGLLFNAEGLPASPFRIDKQD